MFVSAPAMGCSTTVCSAAMRSSATVRCSTTVRSATMGCSAAMRPTVGFTAARSAMRFSAVRSTVATIVVAVSIMTVLGLKAAAAVVAASALTMEAMLAPAVAIAPAGPGAHAEEDAIVEVPRPVKSIGRASVGRSFVIAPLTDGWNADFNGNLSFRGRHDDQARKQYYRSE